MNKEDRLELENELLLTKSKAQMINLYLDLLEENQQLKEDCKNLMNIINNNCKELDIVEEEFESLKRWNK